jgi:two-component system, NarL family, sensor kinase
VIGLLRLEGRNPVARIGALVRLALLPLLFLFESLETPTSPDDLEFGGAVLGTLVVYAVLSTVVAFAARRELPPLPFAVVDVVLLSLLVCAEGGALSEVRFVLFVPVLVAVLSGPRHTSVVGMLSVTGFAVAAVAAPLLGVDADSRVLVVHGLDIAWRAALAVAVSVLLTQRAERNRRLAESRRSLVAQALEAEARARRDLSYALHDELVQALLCAQQDLKVARRGRGEYIDRADHALDDAVRRLRHEIFQLHPHVLETAGLQTALTAVAAQVVLPGGATPAVAVAPDAAGVADQLLFSLGRELLTNVGRHAGARHAELTVSCEGDTVVLRCRDDGRGMAPDRREAALAGGHLGLAACTERVEAVGGTLELRSRVGAGTDVRATIPAAGRRAPVEDPGGLRGVVRPAPSAVAGLAG